MEEYQFWLEIIANGGIAAVAVAMAVWAFKKLLKSHEDRINYLQSEIDELQTELRDKDE